MQSGWHFGRGTAEQWIKEGKYALCYDDMQLLPKLFSGELRVKTLDAKNVSE